MWFIALATFGFLLCVVPAVFLLIRKSSKKKDSKAEERTKETESDYDHKSIACAKRLMRSNVRVAFWYKKLVACYKKPEEHSEFERERLTLKILQEIDDIKITAALCTLAKIEAIEK